MIKCIQICPVINNFWQFAAKLNQLISFPDSGIGEIMFEIITGTLHQIDNVIRHQPDGNKLNLNGDDNGVVDVGIQSSAEPWNFIAELPSDWVEEVLKVFLFGEKGL